MEYSISLPFAADSGDFWEYLALDFDVCYDKFIYNVSLYEGESYAAYII